MTRARAVFGFGGLCSLLFANACGAAGAAARSGRVPGLAAGAGGAQVFAPGIISDGDASCPAFTRDGRTLYFMRERGGAYTIYVSRFAEGRWSEPTVAPFSGEHADIDPFVTPDGESLLFASRRPTLLGDSTAAAFQLWRVPLEGDGKVAPIPPHDPGVSRFFATTTVHGRVYFVNRDPRIKRGNEIWTGLLRNGALEEIGPVTELNTPYSDSNPLIAPDGSFLIFFSNRPGGYGNSDLYISRRDGDGWTAPRNLGPLVNSPDSENCPALSPDGETLFFARGRRDAAGTVVSRNTYYLPVARIANPSAPTSP